MAGRLKVYDANCDIEDTQAGDSPMFGEAGNNRRTCVEAMFNFSLLLFHCATGSIEVSVTFLNLEYSKQSLNHWQDTPCIMPTSPNEARAFTDYRMLNPYLDFTFLMNSETRMN
jgi:hypothetical protein